jgi:uncharacterized membrane protein YphA (DoxX/SURF4 family)
MDGVLKKFTNRKIILAFIGLLLFGFIFSQVRQLQFAVFDLPTTFQAVFGFSIYFSRWTLDLLLLVFVAIGFSKGYSPKSLLVACSGLFASLLIFIAVQEQSYTFDDELTLIALMLLSSLSSVFFLLFAYFLCLSANEKTAKERLVLLIVSAFSSAIWWSLPNDIQFDDFLTLIQVMILPCSIIVAVSLLSFPTEYSESAPVTADRTVLFTGLLGFVTFLFLSFLFSIGTIEYNASIYELMESGLIIAVVASLLFFGFLSYKENNNHSHLIYRFVLVTFAVIVGYSLLLLMAGSEITGSSGGELITLPYVIALKMVDHVVPAVAFWVAFEMYKGKKRLIILSGLLGLPFIVILITFLLLGPEQFSSLSVGEFVQVPIMVIVLASVFLFIKRKHIVNLFSLVEQNASGITTYGYNPTPWLSYQYSSPPKVKQSLVLRIPLNVISIALRFALVFTLFFEWSTAGALGLLSFSDVCADFFPSIYWVIPETLLALCVLLGFYCRTSALLLLVLELLTQYIIGSLGASIVPVFGIEEAFVKSNLVLIALFGAGHWSLDYYFATGSQHKKTYMALVAALMAISIPVGISIEEVKHKIEYYGDEKAAYILDSEAEIKKFQVLSGTEAMLKVVDEQVYAAYINSGNQLSLGRSSDLNVFNKFIEENYPNVDYRVLERDFWGTLFEIEVKQDGRREYRSAGPDRRMQTQDDILLVCGQSCQLSQEFQGGNILGWVWNTSFWQYENEELRSLAYQGNLANEDGMVWPEEKTCRLD